MANYGDNLRNIDWPGLMQAFLQQCVCVSHHMGPSVSSQRQQSYTANKPCSVCWKWVAKLNVSTYLWPRWNAQVIRQWQLVWRFHWRTATCWTQRKGGTWTFWLKSVPKWRDSYFSLALAQHVRYAMRCTKCFMQMLVLSTSLMVEAVIGK